MFLAAILVSSGTAPAAPRLVSDTTVANAGYYQLRWSAGSDESIDFVVQESTKIGFDHAEVLYRGPDRATTISGRGDGVYHYRVRTYRDGATGAWSKSVTVTVQHHPLERALAFFIAGLIVLAATAAIILRHRDEA